MTERSANGPIEMDPEEFRALAHRLGDRLADFLASLRERPVSCGEAPAVVREALGQATLPELGTGASALLDEAADLLFAHSLFNGHPRFWGYITSSPAPIGILGDFLASAVNQNVGWWGLSPMANEIEAQTVRWLAELIGYPADCGGLLVTGGNMANFVGFLVARMAKAPWDVRVEGLTAPGARPVRVYCSAETHTWIHKAADMYGLGTASIRWVPVGTDRRLDPRALRARVREDLDAGDVPCLVVGTAGSVGTGVVDPLPEIAEICQANDIWFHVDGAYGGFAAASPEAPHDIRALALADSVAIDPHKWLYAPIEAGCALVRDKRLLHRAFSYKPPYFHFAEDVNAADNYYEYGPQSTRAFRALKVWLSLRRAGRRGHVEAISDNIRLARVLHRLADEHAELEALTTNLSITTFRYVPLGMHTDEPADEAYLNMLNAELVSRIQSSGDAYVSNAIVDGKFAARACLVNFRSNEADLAMLVDLAVRVGRDVHSARVVTRSVAEASGDIAAALAATAVFGSIGADGIAALGARAHRRSHPAGSTLMRQGDESRSMHLVLSGRFRLERYHSELPEPQVLGLLGPGETVGELGVLDGGPRSATVTAVEDSETLVLEKTAIADAIAEHPEMGDTLLRTLSRRLRNDAEVAQRILAWKSAGD